MLNFFLILGFLYLGFLSYFLIGLYRIQIRSREQFLTVTVLVPARNEEKNITLCIDSLWNQTYPREWYKVIIIDDQSIDQTAAVVENLIKDKPNFQLLHHPRHELRPTFKKQALKYAMNNVQSEIIMTIDADSVAQPNWIEWMVASYDPETGLVAGLVTFFPEYEKTIFHKIQTLEFAGIVFCGVGAVGNNNPLICNGSNLSYRLRAFLDAGGYDGNEFLPSGDDDLLLQNIHKRTPWKIKYSLNHETINYTRSLDNWREFLNQRARWASKSLHYPQKWLLLVMLLIYFYYLLIIIFFPLALLQIIPWKIYLLGLAMKLIPEFFMVTRAAKILARKNLLKYFLLAQIFQILYVIVVGFLGFFNRFTWKGHSSGSAKKTV
jgi:cellulose synthase/poly-beta-1,6-N-acetylglucosamine synthase-like glycosyltransferase